MCVLFPYGCVYISLLSIYKDRYLSLCEYVFNQAFKFMVCIIEILSFSFLCPPRARLIFLLKGMFSPFLLFKLSDHLLSNESLIISMRHLLIDTLWDLAHTTG